MDTKEHESLWDGFEGETGTEDKDILSDVTSSKLDLERQKILKAEEEFEFSSGDDSPEGEDKEKEDVKSEDNSISTFNTLKTMGIIEHELKEGEELTPEYADNILYSMVDSKLEKKTEEFVENLPDVLKQMVTYHKSGGNVDEYIDHLIKTKQSSVGDNLDLSKVSNQERVVAEYLKKQGLDSNDIENDIENLKLVDGQLEKRAKLYYDKLSKELADQKALILEEQKRQVELEQSNIREIKAQIANHISDKDSIEGLKLSQVDRRYLPSYITERTVSLQDGSSITQMERDLYKVFQDPEKTSLLALLLKKGLNIEEIRKHVTTEVTEDVKSKIRNSKKEASVRSSNRYNNSNSSKSILDYL